MNIRQLLQHHIPESLAMKWNTNMSKLPELFQAKVTEQLNGALFSIQKGTISYHVQISGEVEVGKEYLFRSKADGNGTMLLVEKPMPVTEKNAPPISTGNPVEPNQQHKSTQYRVESLLQQYGVKMPEATTRDVVKTIEGYNGTQKEIALELTKFLLLRNGQAPHSIASNLNMLTSSVLSNDTLANAVEPLKQSINLSTTASPEVQKWQTQMETITTPMQLHSKQEMMLFLKKSITNLGLNYEQGLAQKILQHQPFARLDLEQLKPLLLELSQWVKTTQEKSAITELVAKLTGFQILNREEGSTQHVFLPITVQLEKDIKEWYVQISSKKKKGELVDPDYCRIVLLLDLPIFSSTMIDLFVQKKVITLAIHHSYAPIESLVEKTLPLLKTNLSLKGFTLSTVKLIPQLDREQEEVPLQFFKKILESSEEGVDVRI